MSKVEMDLSEYDKMIETKNLLVSSNNDLKKAYEEIEKLQREKIEVLKENEHNVTIVEQVSTMQSAYLPISNYELRERLNYLGVRIPETTNFNHSDIQQYLFGCLFEFQTHTSQSVEDKIVYSKSLKEIKHEMKVKVKDELNEEIKNDLKSVDKLKKEINSFRNIESDLKSKHNEEIKSLMKTIKELNNDMDKLKKDKDDYSKIITTNSEKHQEEINKFKTFISTIENTTNFVVPFGSKTKIKEINEICNKFLEKNK